MDRAAVDVVADGSLRLRAGSGELVPRGAGGEGWGLYPSPGPAV